MHLLDHLLFAAITVAQPLLGLVSFRRLMRRIRAGQPVSRRALYDGTIVSHWTLFGVTMALWAGSGRDWPALGFGLDPGRWFAGGVLLAIAAIVLLRLQVSQLRSATDADLRRFRDSLGNLEFLIPRNGNELGRFYGLSVTAGIVEEVLWRGYLIWYLAHWLPPWPAAIVSGAWFGLAHLYQGAANLPRIMLVGIGFAALYLMTGSLWVPMLLHTAVDVFQGRLAFEVVARTDDAPPARAEHRGD